MSRLFDFRHCVAVCLTIAMCACASRPIFQDPVYRETERRHARPRLDGEQFDDQEYDPELASIFSAVDSLAEREVANVPRDENFIFHFWSVKKALLHDEYGIEWLSPAEINRTIEYEKYGQPSLTEIERRIIADEVGRHLLSKTERIHGMWRDADGSVGVATVDDDVLRHHSLSGHDETWMYLGAGVVEVYPITPTRR